MDIMSIKIKLNNRQWKKKTKANHLFLKFWLSKTHFMTETINNHQLVTNTHLKLRKRREQKVNLLMQHFNMYIPQDSIPYTTITTILCLVHYGQSVHVHPDPWSWPESCFQYLYELDIGISAMTESIHGMIKKIVTMDIKYMQHSSSTISNTGFFGFGLFVWVL